MTRPTRLQAPTTAPFLATLGATAALLAITLVPDPTAADPTACVSPSENGDLPGHVRAARRTMREFRPESPGGWVERADGVYENVKRFERGELARGEAGGPDGRAVGGTLRIPILPMFYRNESIPYPAGVLEARLFTEAASMRTYYEEVSYGNLDVEGTVFDWTETALPRSFYEGSDNGFDGGIAFLLREALILQDDAIDFGQFDNDGPDGDPNSGDDDGIVDVMGIVHSTNGGECSGSSSVWSHHHFYSSWFGPAFRTNDPSANGGWIYVDRYFMAPAMSCNGEDMNGIGVFCHEVGHALGIVDLYDNYEDYQGDSNGIGFWGLMASGDWNSRSSPAHPTAWTKHRLGWLSYLNPTTDLLGLCLPPVETNPTALRLWGQGAASDEYFVVENRQRLGFDAMLAGEGLVIYHVDEARYDLLKENNAVNADESLKSIDVECADALLAGHVLDADDLDTKANRGDSTDVWCVTGGGTEFGATTIPDSRSYGDMATGVAVRNVGACSGGGAGPPDWVCADFLVGLGSPVDVCVEDCDTDGCNEIATCEAYWETPNVWVDNDQDGDHDEPALGEENVLHVKVRNLGPDIAVATTAQVYYAPGGAGLEWPADATGLLGTIAFPVIDPGESLVRSLTVDWPAQIGDLEHYCLGVVLGQAWDPTLSSSAALSNNIAQVNSPVLIARAADSGPAPAGRAACGGAFERTTKVYLHDGFNPGQKPVFPILRVGSPPDFSDAVIPDGWDLDITPGLGPFALGPGVIDSVEVTLKSASAYHGDAAHVPLTLWDPATAQAIGGITLDFRIDCHDPAAPEGLTAQWRDAPEDDLIDDTVLVEWTPVTVDLGGNPEEIQYYEVWRQRDGGVNFLVDRVTIDREPQTPGFQFYDSLPPADCPAQYSYEVRAVDVGSYVGPFSEPFELGCVPLATSAPEIVERPHGLRLAAHPNPVAGSATVRFELPDDSPVRVTVYDARGSRVDTLVDEVRSAGAHAVAWSGRDATGRRLASGVYFVRLEAGDRSETRKIVRVN